MFNSVESTLPYQVRSHFHEGLLTIEIISASEVGEDKLGQIFRKVGENLTQLCCACMRVKSVKEVSVLFEGEGLVPFRPDEYLRLYGLYLQKVAKLSS